MTPFYIKSSRRSSRKFPSSSKYILTFRNQRTTVLSGSLKNPVVRSHHIIDKIITKHGLGKKQSKSKQVYRNCTCFLNVSPVSQDLEVFTCGNGVLQYLSYSRTASHSVFCFPEGWKKWTNSHGWHIISKSYKQWKQFFSPSRLAVEITGFAYCRELNIYLIKRLPSKTQRS